MIKNKIFFVMCTLMAFLLLSACGKEMENIQNNPFMEEQDDQLHINDIANGNDKEITDTEEMNIQLGKINESLFSEKITGCYYADAQSVIIAAEKLYLYDLKNEKIIASVDISLEDINVQTISDGWFICGRPDMNSAANFFMSGSGEEMTGYILNRDFSVRKKIVFSDFILNDFVLSPESIALSDDGEIIAVSGLQGLYLYNTRTEQSQQVLNFSENATANDMRILTIDSIWYIEDNKTLFYVGQGVSIAANDGQNGFSIYGKIAVDGSSLSISSNAAFVVDEVLKGNNIIVLTQSMQKNDGTCLVLDLTTNSETKMPFNSSGEGKNGVFCSRQGKYIATSVLEEKSLVVCIYDTISGKQIYTETISNDNELYFMRIPQILILDESKTCIVLMGRGINEVNTLVSSFSFEE